jgi:CRP/FNR family cyclic AMP-dependent transcriptional regulator
VYLLYLLIVALLGSMHMTQLQTETIAKGQIIFKEGDRDFHFYILQEGSVEIFTFAKSGQRVVISTMGEGEAFGEFSLLDYQPRSATAVAISDCKVVKISDAAYQELLRELPDWASTMLKSFAGRLKSMNERIKKLEK